ncbi:alpha/beta fold hydrolase, partial [bacterium]
MPEPHRRLRQAQFSDHMVEGRCLRVARFGSEAVAPGRPLLFFSGIGANIELLAPFLESVKGREVITFDMPGLGGSAPGSGPYRLSAMADISARILKDLGVGKADVMGVSWGGMLAQEFAYRHPQIVNRLVLAATTAGFPLVPGSPSSLVKMVTSQRYANPGAIDDYLHALYG